MTRAEDDALRRRFTGDWLALREPFDRAARLRNARHLERRLALLSQRPSIKVTDLGCGAGSNLRFLGGRLGAPSAWRMVDNDSALLAMAGTADASRVGACDAAISATERHDLADLAGLSLEGTDLVTASALLDLVSDDWLAALVHRCAAAGAHALFALNYDGRQCWWPRDPLDAAIHAAFDHHQRTDKGFGPALGPRASVRALHWLRNAGMRAASVSSDWSIDASTPTGRRMLAALVEGHASAVAETGLIRDARIDAWRERRHAWIDAHTARTLIGHRDIVARPAAPPRRLDAPSR